MTPPPTHTLSGLDAAHIHSALFQEKKKQSVRVGLNLFYRSDL